MSRKVDGSPPPIGDALDRPALLDHVEVIAVAGGGWVT